MASYVMFAVVLGVICLIFGGLYVTPMSNESRSIVIRIQVFIFAEFAIFIGSYFIWRRLTKPLNSWSINVVCKNVLKGILMVFLVFVHLSFATDRSSVLTQPETRIFSFISYACLGFFVQIICCLVFVDTMHWMLRIILNSRHSLSARTPTRVKSIKAFLAVIYALLAGFYGIYNASLSPTVTHVTIPIQGLPPSQSGVKIVQICDLHIGPTIGRSGVEDVVDIVNRLEPDIVVIVGDLVDATVEKMLPAVKPLEKIQSRLGKYFVTGNHEYLSGGVEKWFVQLQTMGIDVLHNSHRKIRVSTENPDDFFYLAGTDDYEAARHRYAGHGMDLEKAVGDCDTNVPIVLLAHQPRAARYALDSHFNIKLVLSGHTHGGQMIPMTLIAYLTNPFYAGLYEYKGANVYVSQGTMYWGIPMRHFSSREITVINLEAKA